VDAITELWDRVNLYKTLKQADKYTELCGKIGVITRWNGERTVMDILTPDKCVVEEDPDYPTQITRLAYTIGQTDNPHLAQQVNLYRVWTVTETYISEVNESGVELSVSDMQVNPYGRIPVAWFEIDSPLDTFWLDQGNPFVELNRRINLQLTNLDIAIDFQSFSTMVTEGMDSSSSIPIGVTRRLNIPRDGTDPSTSAGKAYYITPDAKLLEVWQIIRESIIWFAGTMGISSESISNGSDFSSGFQLKLSKQGVIDRNKDKQDLYRESVRDLCQLVLDTETIYGVNSYPADTQINIDFADIAVAVDPLEQEQIRAMKMSNGTMDSVMALLEDNPDLTEEEAEAIIAKIRTRRQPTMQGYQDNLAQGMGVDESNE
jgi:hypothetical protein